MNNIIHKSHVKHYPDPKILAEEIGNLKYDSLANLFQELSNKFLKDAKADSFRGRKKLAKYLDALYSHSQMMKFEAEKLWKICEPYMKENE